jgi:hypothetical protein
VTATSSARAHLDRAAATIARSAVGEPIAPIPRRLIPLLPPTGAITALLTILLIRGVAAIVPIHVTAAILTFFAGRTRIGRTIPGRPRRRRRRLRRVWPGESVQTNVRSTLPTWSA